MSNTRKKLRLGGYVRVSHVGGRDGDSFHSPEDQERAIRDYAARHGHAVTMYPADLDESGGKTSRPNLDAAVAAVEAGEIDGIVVAYGSRLMRNVRGALELWDRLDAAGGQYVNIALDIDTTTPEGRLVRTTLAAIDEYELDRHRSAFERLKRESTARGIWQRRQAPVGYVKDPETRRLVPGPDAPRVLRAFEQRAAGVPVVTIAEELGQTSSNVRRVLRNRLYLGELHVGPYSNLTAHEPIVPVELFERVQADSPRPPRNPERKAIGPRLLAGLVRCASCGHIANYKTNPRGDTYTCLGLHSGARCPQTAGISAPRLEEYVVTLALHELDRLEGEGAPRRSQLADLEAEEREARAELEAFVLNTATAGIDPTIYAAGLTARQERLDAVAESLLRERERDGATSLALGGREAWERLDAAGQNAVLRALLEAVAVRPVGRGQRVPVEERVVVFRAGAGLDLPRRNGAACGLLPLPTDPQHPEALRV